MALPHAHPLDIVSVAPLGAGLRQADGDGLADAATGAGHQGSLAVEAETGQH